MLGKEIFMIKIMKNSELQGAAKYGNCASCGKGSDEAEIYKIECGDSSTCVNSFNLCLDCLAELGDLAVKEHIKTGTGYCGKGATSSGECEAPCSCYEK